MTPENCPTPQTSPTYIAMNTMTIPTKSHRMEIWGIIPDKRKMPHGWPACLKKQPPRVAFKNNDIYMINSEESDHYEEPKEHNMRVFYKLKVNEDPTSKNMPHIIFCFAVNQLNMQSVHVNLLTSSTQLTIPS